MKNDLFSNETMHYIGLINNAFVGKVHGGDSADTALAKFFSGKGNESFKVGKRVPPTEQDKAALELIPLKIFL